MKAKSLLRFVIFLAIIGFCTSVYLTYTHYGSSHSSTVCEVGDIGSCDIVNTSIYSEIFGIPVAILGAVWFLVLIYFANKTIMDKKSTSRLFSWNVIGMVFVAYFIFAEIQLRAICTFCTVVHIIVLISFLISLWLRRKAKLFID